MLTLIKRKQEELQELQTAGFKASRASRSEEWRCMTKESILQEDITILTCMCPQQSTRLHEANTDRSARRNGLI